MGKHEELTQKYSTWGSKLLQHADVLHAAQSERRFIPITVQLCPTEVCESHCAFCSVEHRPMNRMPWESIEKVLRDFKILGAKSLEITGGGNPMMWREGNYDITTIIRFAHDLGYNVGIITNSHNLLKISSDYHECIDWIRISLIKLDEGKEPEDYNFGQFPVNKIGFSYIIYDGEIGLSKLGRERVGTTIESIKKLARMVELYPDAKFVRIAGNCLIKGNNAAVRDHWRPIVDEIDKHGKFFVKDIGDDDDAFKDGCYVGMVRPYVASSPNGGGYHVYTCTSHVLNTRTYDMDYALCSIEDIIPAWNSMNESFKKNGYPYQVKGNCGKNWNNTCKFCYYKKNNELLHTVVTELPDRNFA